MATRGENELVEVMSSHSELNDSEARESISEHSEEDISETSEDRAFVVSDGEESAYSNGSSASSNYSQHCHMHSNDSFGFNGQKVPISIVTKRVIQQNETYGRTWAAIAASGTSDPQPSLQRPEKDRNCVRISTQRSLVDPRDNENSEGNAFGRYLSTESANTYIRSALLSAPSTQDAEVAGIGTTKTGYLIRFKDSGSAEAARNNTEWLNELGNNTKLVKPRFGIVVHRTPTENFDLENANSQAIQRIMEENDLADKGFQIEELAWLKRKDKVLGKFASLGIWFDSAEGAEYILNNGLLVGQRYIGSHGRARKHHAVDIVQVNTSGNDAPQGSGLDAWIVAANTQLVTDSVLHPQLPTPIN
ncbi:hypothetical protein PENARI_c186G03264, partial [Penicillium arizonense]